MLFPSKNTPVYITQSNYQLPNWAQYQFLTVAWHLTRQLLDIWLTVAWQLTVVWHLTDSCLTPYSCLAFDRQLPGIWQTVAWHLTVARHLTDSCLTSNSCLTLDMTVAWQLLDISPKFAPNLPPILGGANAYINPHQKCQTGHQDNRSTPLFSHSSHLFHTPIPLLGTEEAQQCRK
jgi:hypothetical protein